MAVSIRLPSGGLRWVDIDAETTIADLWEELQDVYHDPIFSYQGQEYKRSSQTLADLGICPEAVIEVRNTEPIQMFVKEVELNIDECPRRKDIAIIIDTLKEELCCLYEKYYKLCVWTSKLEKIGYNKYQRVSGLMTRTYDISDGCTEIFGWVDINDNPAIKFKPVDSINITVNWDAEDMDMLREKYSKFTFTFRQS